jgi:hypothetical protein
VRLVSRKVVGDREIGGSGRSVEINYARMRKRIESQASDEVVITAAEIGGSDNIRGGGIELGDVDVRREPGVLFA